MTRRWWERPVHVLLIPLYIGFGLWVGLVLMYEDWKAGWPA